jgi:hypothetical protein
MILFFEILSYVSIILWTIAFITDSDHLMLFSLGAFWLLRQSVQIEKLKEKIK